LWEINLPRKAGVIKVLRVFFCGNRFAKWARDFHTINKVAGSFGSQVEGYKRMALRIQVEDQ
jgi:hypothetical protein